MNLIFKWIKKSWYLILRTFTLNIICDIHVKLSFKMFLEFEFYTMKYIYFI